MEILGLFFLTVLFVAIAAIAVYIKALVEVISSDFRGENDKLLWILIILFAGFPGAIVYFVIGRKSRID